MANIKFTNFARSKVATGITSGDTTLSITGGSGALFPALTAGQYFYLTLENASRVREIVKVTARAADTLTIVRAQDGTTAMAWVAGDTVSLRFNALAITESIGNAIQQSSPTGSAFFPSGTTAQRDGSPAAGYMRHNTTLAIFEGYTGAAWVPLAGTDTTTQAAKDATTKYASTAFVDRLRSLLSSTSTTVAAIADRGSLIKITGNIQIPAGVFAENDVFSIYNNSAGALTITQGSGLTLRLGGTTTTGNRTVAARGMATATFVGTDEVHLAGPGVS